MYVRKHVAQTCFLTRATASTNLETYVRCPRTSRVCGNCLKLRSWSRSPHPHTRTQPAKEKLYLPSPITRSCSQLLVPQPRTLNPEPYLRTPVSGNHGCYYTPFAKQTVNCEQTHFHFPRVFPKLSYFYFCWIGPVITYDTICCFRQYQYTSVKHMQNLDSFQISRWKHEALYHPLRDELRSIAK